MKKYIEPKIKAVELDADQAILQVCMVGGAYLGEAMSPGTSRCTPMGSSGKCDLEVRGARTSVNSRLGFEDDATPS